MYFSITNQTSLSSIPQGSLVHFVGVAGVAMAQLAVALTLQGYKVSGSDTDFWEPSGSLLKNSNVTLFHGFSVENLASTPALVVIGNAIRRTNPEAEGVEKLRLPFTSFPQLLYEVVIAEKRSIVIAGTHGKSTTSAITAWCLEKSECSPSYFIGGAVDGLSYSLHQGSGSISVVEGDEYDSAFFAKVPKFDFYQPDILLITSVEFDHADIYPSIKEINTEFSDLVTSVPSDGAIFVADTGENLQKLTHEWKKTSKASLFIYGESEHADVRLLQRTFSADAQTITFSAFGTEHKLSTKLFGKYNAYNCLGSWGCQYWAGIKGGVGFDSFPGVKRRQEVKLQNNRVTIIEDFAHHPTAVHETLQGLRERYGNRKIICCFEPRSNTSRKKIFQSAYAQVFRSADTILIKNVVARHNDVDEDLFSVETLVESLSKQGKPAYSFSSSENLLERAQVEQIDGSIIVVMSNGAFDDLCSKLVQIYL